MINPKTGKRWKIFMGLPSNGSVSDFQNYVLRDLQDRYKDEVELVFPDTLCQRIFHDAAREGIVQDFLDSDCDMIWMLDSDICPPKHCLDIVTMYGDKWQAAGCPYPVFMAQPGESFRQLVFTLYKCIGNAPDGSPKLAPSDCPNEGTAFIDGIATGCLFIKREVFEKLERPYFEFKYDPITRQPILGEDLGFCMKLYRLGIKFFVDYSMACKHFKNNIDLLEMNNFAISYAQKCVNYQSKLIQGQVDVVEKKYNKIKEENKKMREFISALKAEHEGGIRRQPALVSPAGKPLVFR